MQTFPASTIQTLRTRYELDGIAHFTGATVTVDLYAPDGSSLATAVAATEEGNGYYYITLTATHTATKGTHRAVWKGVRSTDCCDVHGKTFYKEELFEVGSTRPDKVSLRELRWVIARLLGDNFVSTATSTSTVSTLTDSLLVTKDVNYVQGGWLYVYEGTNQKLPSRKISSLSNTTATFAPAYSAALDATSKYEIHRRFSVEDYNNAIEQAIRSISNVYLPAIDDNSTIPTNGLINIPDEFDWIYQVWVEPVTDWQQVLRPAAWRIIPGRRQLKLEHDVMDRYSTKPIHIYGLVRPAVPTSDNHSVIVPVEFVIKESMSNLVTQLMGSTQTDSDAFTQQRQIFKNEAELARTRLHLHTPPNVRKVW